MKLYLIPFNAEAKVLTAILPNCRKVSNTFFKNRWEYKGGEVICWNEMGLPPIREVLNKIGNFDKYSSVILFGSAGSLSPNLKLGEVFACTTVKDTENGCWQMPELKGIKINSLLTTKALVFDNNKRMEYYQKYNCDLVDMEASAFAELASQGLFKQSETYIIRFISDTYETLPPFDEAKNTYTKSFLSIAQAEIAKYRKLLI